jgi:hypothetical protein
MRAQVKKFRQKQRKPTMVTAWLVAAAGAALLVSACGLTDTAKQLADTAENVRTSTVNALNDAIDALNKNSAAWQSVLQDAMSKLTDAAQATVRNEIANVASRSIAQSGVEFRCDADFVGDRVRQALVRIKAQFLGESVPPVEPGLCQVVPIAVDRDAVPAHVKQLEFYGYDFDTATNLRVYLVQANGARRDVTNQLDRPTHYAMTLSFGAAGVQLDDASQRFVLEWEGKQISTVAVIQPQTPVCQSKVVQFTPGPVTYTPPHTRGDRDFDGNGPVVDARVDLLVRPQSIDARVYMRAQETKKDWTTAEGTNDFPLFRPDPGWQIDGVVEGSVTMHHYVDSNHTNDSFDKGSGTAVKRFVFVGDTDGDEAGTRTKVDVAFNELRIQETQTANCVSARAILALPTHSAIRAQTLQRLKPAAQEEETKMRRMLTRVIPSAPPGSP